MFPDSFNASDYTTSISHYSLFHRIYVFKRSPRTSRITAYVIQMINPWKNYTMAQFRFL